ncbi:hypothetical protein HF966_05060 [Leuconostoc holzapfelii]|uniref:Uncharacterized protein n=1 Tax=Leuconostoc holzapfelii TaxID=434464 RepID=A0A846ZGV6_9LACO|nr:hypothetical protein [Leuconostoc holzapfelii]
MVTVVNKNRHNALFQYRALLVGIAIVLAIVSIIYPENHSINTFARAFLSLLVSVVLGSYAVERFHNKKWLPFSAYLLVSVLNLLIFISTVFPNIHF